MQTTDRKKRDIFSFVIFSQFFDEKITFFHLRIENRRETLHSVEFCKSALARFPIPPRHILARFVHRTNDQVERDFSAIG